MLTCQSLGVAYPTSGYKHRLDDSQHFLWCKNLFNFLFTFQFLAFMFNIFEFSHRHNYLWVLLRLKAEPGCVNPVFMTLREEHQLQRGCTAMSLRAEALRTSAVLAGQCRSSSTGCAEAHRLMPTPTCEGLCQLASHVALGSSPLQGAPP